MMAMKITLALTEAELQQLREIAYLRAQGHGGRISVSAEATRIVREQLEELDKSRKSNEADDR